MLSTAGAILVLLGLDALWLHLRRDRYVELVEGVQCGRRMEFRALGVLWSYTSFIVGLLVLVLWQNKDQQRRLLLTAAVYGLAVYGVFNGTNHALLEGYTGPMLWQDTAWGLVLCTTVAAVYLYLSGGPQIVADL